MKRFKIFVNQLVFKSLTFNKIFQKIINEKLVLKAQQMTIFAN